MQDIEPYRPFRKNRGRLLIFWAGLAAIVLIVFVVIGLVLFGPKNSAGKSEQAAAASPASVTAQPVDVAPSPSANTGSTSDAAAAPVVDLPSLTQPERRAFVQKLIGQGVFTGVRISPAPPKVGVTPLFQGLSPDLKRQFAAVVEAYVHNGATTTEPLQLIDATNGNSIGTYTVADGLKLQ